MKYRSIISPKAETDYRLAVEWFRMRSATLSKRFARDFRSACQRILANPEAFTERYAQIRICRMEEFPFTVHFHFDSAVNEVLIVGVYHEARSPEVWTDGFINNE